MNSPKEIHQPEDGLSEVVQDLCEVSIIMFDVRLLITVILTRPVNLTYVGSEVNNTKEMKSMQRKRFLKNSGLVVTESLKKRRLQLLEAADNKIASH